MDYPRTASCLLEEAKEQPRGTLGIGAGWGRNGGGGGLGFSGGGEWGSGQF